MQYATGYHPGLVAPPKADGVSLKPVTKRGCQMISLTLKIDTVINLTTLPENNYPVFFLSDPLFVVVGRFGGTQTVEPVASRGLRALITDRPARSDPSSFAGTETA